MYDALPYASASTVESYLFSTERSASTDYAWDMRYRSIWLFNQVISSAEDEAVTGSTLAKKQLKAEAHYLRAMEYFALALNHCLHTTEANANEPGLPLRLNMDFEENLSRASLKETYDLIEADVQESLKLDIPFDGRVWRASTSAVKAFAARFYLYMGEFDKAEMYANEALEEYSGMVDYSTTFTDLEYQGATYTNLFFQMFGRSEYLKIINDQYYDQSYSDLSNKLLPSDELVSLYDENDERFIHFFAEDPYALFGDNITKYKYAQTIRSVASGPSTAEMYLICAEAKARKGDIAGAMAEVENVRRYRFDADKYAPLPLPATKKEAIQEVIDERRREMPFSIRWYDIRRINVDPEVDDITLQRTFYTTTNGVINSDQEPVTVTVEPNSRLYARPINNLVITLSNGQIQQNTY